MNYCLSAFSPDPEKAQLVLQGMAVHSGCCWWHRALLQPRCHPGSPGLTWYLLTELLIKYSIPLALRAHVLPYSSPSSRRTEVSSLAWLLGLSWGCRLCCLCQQHRQGSAAEPCGLQPLFLAPEVTAATSSVCDTSLQIKRNEPDRVMRNLCPVFHPTGSRPSSQPKLGRVLKVVGTGVPGR